MAAPLIGLFDLSVVTNVLIDLVRTYVSNSAIWPSTAQRPNIEVTGSAPDAARSGTDCVVSVYLFHAASDKYQRNTTLPLRPPVNGIPPARRRVPVIPFQPLALDLYYLITAWAGQDYVNEQRAMSVVLKAMHENPSLRSSVNNVDRVEGLTLSMEMESWEEMGRYWQATTTPARLAAVYKVSAVFIAPEELTDTLAPSPATVGLTVTTTARDPLHPALGRIAQPALGGAVQPAHGGQPLSLLSTPLPSYTINGAGFVEGQTSLLIDDQALVEATDPEAIGEGQYAVGTTSIRFRLPAGLAAGDHVVRVRAGGEELPPSWSVRVPS